MKKASVGKPAGRVLARVFARDLEEVIGSTEHQDLGTTPKNLDTTASEAATSEDLGSS
jgi:hypothetical protein